MTSVPANELYFGDNLDVLREKVKDEIHQVHRSTAARQTSSMAKMKEAAH